MPAYFEMSLQFQRKDLYPGFIADFNRTLEQAGLAFSSGFLEDDGLSREEIAVWNQKKLNENFCLGMTEHYSHGYKQTLYRFRGYEEVRGYWMNQYPVKNAFTYFLIIPEYEVLEVNLTFRAEAVEELTGLAQRLWQFPPVRSIQTGLELSDPPLSLAELRRGQSPDACPFVILEPDCHPYDDGSRVVELTDGRPGLLLVEDDMLPIWKKP